MAVRRIAPYTAGTVTRLYPPVGAGQWVHVIAPRGQQIKLRQDDGHVDVWLAQPGEWRARWDGEQDWQTLIVVVAADPQETDPEPAAPDDGSVNPRGWRP